MPDATVSVTKGKAEFILAAIKRLEGQAVYVGFPSSADSRLGMDPGKNARNAGPQGKPTVTNAQLAWIHEHGTEDGHIPARPFMRPAVKAAQPKITARLKQAAAAALDGKGDLVHKYFMATGLETQAALRKKIVDGPFLPLAEETLRRRRAAGFRGTKPLIVTGQLRQACSFVIRSKR